MGNNGGRKGFRVSPRQMSKFRLEPLEPRLLLSADLAVQMAAGANDLTLRMQNLQGVDTVQIVNNADQSVVQSQALADVSGVVITGSDQDDRFVVDFSNPFGDLAISFADTSKTDRDTLGIVGRDTTSCVFRCEVGGVG